MEVLEQALGRAGLLHMRQALQHDGARVQFMGFVLRSELGQQGGEGRALYPTVRTIHGLPSLRAHRHPAVPKGR